MAIGIKVWWDHTPNFRYCACEYTNYVKRDSEAGMDGSFGHKLKELKGINYALWESLDCQVGTIEAKMDVHGSGSNKTPQLNEWIVVTEKTQK